MTLPRLPQACLGSTDADGEQSAKVLFRMINSEVRKLARQRSLPLLDMQKTEPCKAEDISMDSRHGLTVHGDSQASILATIRAFRFDS